MTRAEFVKLRGAGLLGEVRLSCQMRVEDDMRLSVLMTKASEGWPDTGPVPADVVEPEAEWLDPDVLARQTPPA